MQKLYRCLGCGEWFTRARIWFLPYTGQRCTECALKFTSYYKENGAQIITKILHIDLASKMNRSRGFDDGRNGCPRCTD